MLTETLKHYQETNPVTVRPMTRAEGLALGYGNSVEFKSLRGDVRRCKVNGKVRTWKTDANRIEIPSKYGLKEYGTFVWATDTERYESVGSASVYLVKRT